MTYEVWLPILAFFGKLGALLAQERMYEWHWEMHPMWWWGWGIGIMAMMFSSGVGFRSSVLSWASVASKAWNDRIRARNSASKVCPRGNQQEEFEARRKDLGG